MHTYRTERLDPIPEDKNKCGICFRNYNQIEDDSDENEVACQPMRISCGHVFGSKCLENMSSRGISTCPYCARSIVLDDGPIHPLLCWLVLTPWLYAHVEVARMFGYSPMHGHRGHPYNVVHNVNDELAWNSQIQKLFERSLTPSETLKLWLQYFKLLCGSCIVLCLLLVVPALLFGLIFDGPYLPRVELFVLNIARIILWFEPHWSATGRMIFALCINIGCASITILFDRYQPSNYNVMLADFFIARGILLCIGARHVLSLIDCIGDVHRRSGRSGDRTVRRGKIKAPVDMLRDKHACLGFHEKCEVSY